jgi:transposase-like protein
MNLSRLSALTEDQAREKLESIVWPTGPICPHCRARDCHTKFVGKKHRAGVYKCGKCKEQFTVTVGTLLEGSHLPIRTWLMAFALMCSAKKGVSALQLQRQLGIGSYRSAWHLCHLIRHAMKQDPLKGLLKGAVEVDETYVGGKPRKLAGVKNVGGRGTKKIPVVVLVERGGSSRAFPIERVNAKTLKAAIRWNVDRESMILTDEWPAYAGIGAEFKHGHKTVNHGALEYARGPIHVNTAESWNALLKRGIMGSFHHVSKQHLGKYCDEFSYRWNKRKWTDEARTTTAIELIEGIRLMYKQPVRNAA